MIRRLLAVLALALASSAALAPAAGAADDIACVYNQTPLYSGVCVSLP